MLTCRVLPVWLEEGNESEMSCFSWLPGDGANNWFSFADAKLRCLVGGSLEFGGWGGAVLWKHNSERRQLRPHWRWMHLKTVYSLQAGSQVERPARLLFSGITVTLLVGGWFPEWVGATAGFCSSQVEKEPEGKYLVEEPLKGESGASLWVSLRPEVPIYL